MASTETTPLAAEYEQLTERCGLVDRSERGKLALTGEDAVEFLNGQVSNELLDLRPGQGRYAVFLTHKGKMLGDLRVLAAGSPGEAPGELLLDSERAALQGLFDMIRRFKVGYRVELHKRTLESSLLSLIGPASAAVAERAFLHGPSTTLPSSEHDHVAIDHVTGGAVRLIATDVGFDVLCDSEARESIVARLIDAGAVSVSEDAAEIVRVESGRPRYGIDADESTIPQEAGLNERTVSFTKGCYVGQETVARLHYRGKPNRHLRGLLLSEPVSAGAELRLEQRPVGTLTSSVLSPVRGPIGLALVRREAEPGATLAVGDGNAAATVVELPFQ
ncbi:MAG TPA: glycine cleavage T C-terminal barrel domain-containing protein [Solirubrobacteraceae bacterium]|nr:glycine cleavage T C-terminal barrel domain-containing protein [Solirubrobacteraceae bacterium]